MSGYRELGQRAEEFVEASGGAVAEERLIGHVFGSGGDPALWRPLLRQILAGHSRLTLRADGFWALPRALVAPDRLPADYVVVDLETTGLKPRQQRVIEIALVCVAGGAQVETYSTLVNPERRLPAYIAKLTGIDDSQLVAAPRFIQIAAEVLERLEGQLVVGFNVEFDVGFLNAELQRLGRPLLINQRLDLLPLAARLVGNGRRPGLDGLCRALDLPVRERHRALADAELTAQAFVQLMELARRQGIDSLDGLLRAAAGEVPIPRRRDGVGRGRSVLDKSHLDGIPHAPGVYLMRDARDRVIYVGKAKDLRNRVASYYSQPLGYTRKMDGLLESIARIEVTETGSELEALLLESQLIRRYQPQYNRQLRNTEGYPYIVIDVGNPWPRVRLTKQRKDDGAVYFGPFRMANAARATVDLIYEIFPLRSCSRSFKSARSYGSPCLELALGRCPGPCVGSADRDAYRRTVYQVIAFLHGDQEQVIARLHDDLSHAAERLDFERAARLRDRLRRVQQLVLSQQVLDEAAERGNALLVTSSPLGGRELLLIIRGRLWARVGARPGETDVDVAGRLGRAWARAQAAHEEIDHDSLDEVYILSRWLRRFTGHPAILLLANSPDWRALARTALDLTTEQLRFAERNDPPEDDEGQNLATVAETERDAAGERHA